jgi:hypothetical protein
LCIVSQSPCDHKARLPEWTLIRNSAKTKEKMMSDPGMRAGMSWLKPPQQTGTTGTASLTKLGWICRTPAAMAMASWPHYTTTYSLLCQGPAAKRGTDLPCSQMKLDVIKMTTLTRGVTQVVEHLLCKHKALSSNPSPTKKKRKDIPLAFSPCFGCHWKYKQNRALWYIF